MSLLIFIGISLFIMLPDYAGYFLNQSALDLIIHFIIALTVFHLVIAYVRRESSGPAAYNTCLVPLAILPVVLFLQSAGKLPAIPLSEKDDLITIFNAVLSRSALYSLFIISPVAIIEITASILLQRYALNIVFVNLAILRSIGSIGTSYVLWNVF